MTVANLLIANGSLIASTQIAGCLLEAVEGQQLAAVVLATEHLRYAVSEAAGEEHSAFRGRVEDLAGKSLEALEGHRAGGEVATPAVDP